MKTEDFDSWVRRYVAAWDSNDPDEISALFTEDAEYFTAPFRQPWRGRPGIVKGWLDRKDKPGDHDFSHQVIAVIEDLGVVRGWTRYPEQTPAAYSNLWLIRLRPGGQATSFTEWWMAEDSK